MLIRGSRSDADHICSIFIGERNGLSKRMSVRGQLPRIGERVGEEHWTIVDCPRSHERALGIVGTGETAEEESVERIFSKLLHCRLVLSA